MEKQLLLNKKELEMLITSLKSHKTGAEGELHSIQDKPSAYKIVEKEIHLSEKLLTYLKSKLEEFDTNKS